MFALSPTNLSNLVSRVKDITNHDFQQNFLNNTNIFRDTESTAHEDTKQSLEHDDNKPGDMAKKLNHNASERYRRKKINCLYSSLRSLLPDSDHSKKLSIPATVSQVLKYIPELQEQVELLTQKKEQLLLNLNKQSGRVSFRKSNQQRRGSAKESSVVVSTTKLGDGDGEFLIHISSYKTNYQCPLSEILINLESDGLVHLINSSCFQSNIDGKLFYNLHFQVEENLAVKSEELIEKLVSLIISKQTGHGRSSKILMSN